MPPFKEMTEYRLKITGVHYAANPKQRAGQPDTDEMHVRTRKMLSWVKDDAPFVVLKPDPSCRHNPDAVAARVLGTRIGYVGDDWLWVTVNARELTQLEPLSSMEIEWKLWMSDLPLLPPNDDEEAEQEATYVLDHMLQKNVDNDDQKQLKVYLNIWLRGSRHGEPCSQYWH